MAPLDSIRCWHDLGYVSSMRLYRDLGYALRVLRASPSFAAVAALTLALGIGGVTSVYTWVRAVVLRPLPGVSGPEQIFAVSFVAPDGRRVNLSYLDFQDYATRSKTLAGLTVFDNRTMAVSTEEGVERVWGMLVSGNYFDVLGVEPSPGRGFSAEEILGRKNVAVISHGLWRRLFGTDPNVVGKALGLNGRVFTVCGVAPEMFQGSYAGERFDVWVPLTVHEAIVPGGDRLKDRGRAWLGALARVERGVTREQAEAELEVVAVQLEEEFPESSAGARVSLVPLQRLPHGVQGAVAPILFRLTGGVLAVLMIACVNVANLWLARAAARRREMALRAALGASRGALIRQLLTETAVLSLLAGVAGVLIAFWTTDVLVTFLPSSDFPFFFRVEVDYGVLVFTMTLSLVTGFAFGLAPALWTSKNLAGGLSGAPGPSSIAHETRTLSGMFVTVQLALALVLLVCSGLMLRSLVEARSVNPGFNPNNVLLVSLNLDHAALEPDVGRALYLRLLERLGGVSGVESVSLSRRAFLGWGGRGRLSLAVESGPAVAHPDDWARYDVVGPAYLQTLEIPLVRGRDFDRRDRVGAQPVAIVNETLARRYWPGGRALGKRLRVDGEWVRVVGVARDSRYLELDEEPMNFVFLPVLQRYQPDVILHLRTTPDPLVVSGAVREAIEEVQPRLPVFGIRAMETEIQAASFHSRLASRLINPFSAIALLLASVGVYGTVAQAAQRRRNEIGIRIALGATASDIVRLVMKTGVPWIGLGAALGVAGALAAARVIRSLLYGVSATDFATFATAIGLLVVVSTAGTLLPARRATKVDPVEALRRS